MKDKVILIVIDGLAFKVAEQCMGFVQALGEEGLATLYKVQCELPSMSRPLYETILTGVTPAVSGIVHNQVVRKSNQESVFSLARKAGCTTAAAAFHWFSELYNESPYSAVRDRYTVDIEKSIQYGAFYHDGQYPDGHLYLDAELLRRRYDPDFLLIHPMSIDEAGHRSGLDSSHYRNTTRRSDKELSEYLRAWIEAGYQIIITADHGMNTDKSHGGCLAEERDIPLYVIGDRFSHQTECAPRQTEICGVICELLGIIDHSKPVTENLLQNEESEPSEHKVIMGAWGS